MDTEPYPPVIAELLAIPCRMPLGPGAPEQAAYEMIRRLDSNAPKACLAGLWLRFNHLDESHAVSQELHTPEGSFWHAVMHRREPDAANSKYWWRKMGSHPVLQHLVEQAPVLGYDYRNPFEFVEFCERVRGSGGKDEAIAEKVQALEWQLLFDWCLQIATA